MSKMVDERVVEMRFDNKDFEKNVSTTMSTLDKLKAALKLPTSSKGFDNISRAAKNVDFSGMTNGIETVNARFSAMQVIGMTALSNITSAAMRAGSNIVKSLTIEPVTSGFREYELQMNSIQTILANTKSKGTTMADVTAALDELNEYADLTIYNFAEMTKNIGTFTAAGVDLDTSVGAIKGIANLGAMSSSTSAQVSTAMYQLSQALATGRVSLMDWNSVVNAGMGGEQFQNALKRTAENFGYDVDSMIKKYGSFRESLTQGGWLTAEVLNETLNQIGGAYDEAELRAKGYSEENIKAILDLAQTATEAATEVKTFTQLFDTLKEAAGSGWAKTWQLIFGDFEQAKEFFSGLHEMLEPIVTGPIDAMNGVIEKAMGGGESRWGEFESQLSKAGISISEFQNKLSEVASSKGVNLDQLIADYGSLEKAMASGSITADMVTEAFDKIASSAENSTEIINNTGKSLEQWQKVVNDVWRGDYGNIDTGRMERLASAGWKYEDVQKLVNLGYQYKLTLEDLSEAQIIQMGYSKEQAAAFAEVAKEAKAAGEPLNTLINDVLNPKRSGRELFLEGIENTLTAILRPLQAIGAAFGDVFGMDADGLYNLIDGFNKFSKAIIISEDDAENLRKTFKGLFSVIHLLTTAAGNGLVLAFKAVNAVLGLFGSDLLTVTGTIGEAVYQFEQWVTSGEAFKTILDGIGSALSFVTAPLQGFFGAFASLPGVSTALSTLQSAFASIFNYFKSFQGLSISEIFGKIVSDVKGAYNKLKAIKWTGVLSGLSSFGDKVREIFGKVVDKIKEVGPDIIEGLQNGLKDGVDGIVEWMRSIGEKIIEAVKAVLGIHSPSTVFFEIGKNIIEGLCNGIKYLSGQVTDTLIAVINDVKSVMSSIDWGPILAVSAAAGTFIVFYQLTDALQTFATGLKSFTAPAQSAAGVMDAVRDGIRAFTGTNTSSKGLKNIADSIKIFAEAIAILAGAVAVLSVLDVGSVWMAVGVIAALAAILGILAAALTKFSSGATVLEQIKLNSIFLSLASAFLILAIATRVIAGVEWEALGKAAVGLAALTGVVAALVIATRFAGDINGAAAVLSKIGIAFLMLAATAKILGGMQATEMDNATMMLATFTGVVTALILATQFASKHIDKAASFISKIGMAFLLLSASAKILGGMSAGEMDNATTMLSVFTGVVTALVLVTQFGNKHVDKVTDFLSKIGVAFLALAVAARLLGGMTFEDMGHAAVALAGLVGVITLLVLITNLAPKEQIAKISATLLAMSAAIAILAGVAVLLGMIKTENLVKGIAAISALSLLVALMTVATRGAANVKGTFIGMAVAIAAIAASVAVLSFIEPAKLFSAATALGAVMAVFALVINQTSRLKKMKVGPIIAMTVMLAALSALLYLLAGLPVENTQGAALALSGTLTALAAACKIVSTIETVSKDALIGVGVMTAVIAALAIIFGLMSGLGVEASLSSAAALSTVLLAMSEACLILSNVQTVSTIALDAMGVLTAIVAGLALVLGLMDGLEVEASIPTAVALSTLLLAMAGVTAILSLIGPMATGAIAAAGSMAAVLGILAGVVAAAGAIKQIPGVEWLVSEGGEFLQSIGEAIGKFIGGFAGGVLDGLTSNLGSVADNLSDFMVRLTPFLVGLKMIDPSAQESITSLANMVLALTGAGLLDAVTSFLTGGSSLTDFANQLVPFGQAMMAYSQAVSGIDAGAIQASATAGQALSELANSLPKEGGLAQAIFGENQDFATFGTQLVAFGVAIKAYSLAIEGINTEAIQASATAGQALSELANSLPKEGGLAQAIFGETTDMGTFGTQMALFGYALKYYASAVDGLNVESIQNSVAAGQAINELAQALPQEDGWVENLFGGGQTSLADFGDNLAAFGEAISSYAESVSGVNFGTINSATGAIRSLINFLKENAEASDGISDGLTAIKKIKDVGTAIKGYGESISGVDMGSVSSSITAIQRLKDVIVSMVGMDTSGVASFKAAIEELGTVSISGLAAKFKLAAAEMMIAGLDIMSNLASGISNGQSLVTGATESNINAMTEIVTASFGTFESNGSMISTSMGSGISDGGSSVSVAIGSVLSSAVGVINGYRGTFYNSGAYISQGLAAGMRSALSEVITVGAQLASAAAKAAQAKAQINSPSRVFMRIGGYMGEGMVIGLKSYTDKVYDSGYAMGDQATKGLSTAIAQLESLDLSDESLNPTITPVMDLTNVRSGVASINSLMENMVPVDTLASLGAINRMTSRKGQNGSFSDVVNAIDRLYGKLDDMPVNQTIVEGVTYDDGTNIALAVGDLTRAIRLEGRV